MITWKLFVALHEAANRSNDNRTNTGEYRPVFVYGMRGKFITSEYRPEVRSYYEVTPYNVTENLYQGFGEVTTTVYNITANNE